MYFSTSVLVAGLVGLAQAQVPSGFTPQATTKLEVIFNSTMVSTAGQQLAKAGKSQIEYVIQDNISDLLSCRDTTATCIIQRYDRHKPNVHVCNARS
jgi:hypothetical protein